MSLVTRSSCFGSSSEAENDVEMPFQCDFGNLEREGMKKGLAIRALPLLVGVLVMTTLIEQGQGNVCTRTFFSSLLQLIPCRSAVAPFGSIPPTEAFFEALKVLGQPCLCVLVNGPPISGVDRILPMKLPEKCAASTHVVFWSRGIYLYYGR